MVADGSPLLDLAEVMSWMEAVQLSDMYLQSRLFSTAIWQTTTEATLIMEDEQQMRVGNVVAVMSARESDRAQFYV